ncbi:DUF2079 domain-containing protein [Actinoplanes sp. NPDC051859]|uniref:DUF2079 domain-containing protein n=1 Tax=Actinoplanes sp. NPDC051859 TaxID=3363909 RepID=UPI00379D2918
MRKYAVQTLRSPCTWIVAVAIYLFASWAHAQYVNMAGPVGACDLGIFYQAVQGWSTNGWPYVAIKGFPQLGDHFSPAFALLAPLLWINDSPLMLVYAQILLLCLSGVPIYHLFRRRHGLWVASGILIAYLCSHAVLRTIAFPVHEVMFGAVLLAWGLERMLTGKWTQATVLFALLVTVKEDGGLLCALLGLYALVNRRWRHGTFLILWGGLWFVLTLKVIIPALNPGGFTYVVDYQQSLHADGIFAGIPYMLSHPLEILALMVDDPEKVTTWVRLLLPLGFVALASPIVLLAVPMMLARMLSSRETQWSSAFYYDMPLMPILFAAAADGIRRIGNVVDRFRGLPPVPDPARHPQPANAALPSSTADPTVASPGSDPAVASPGSSPTEAMAEGGSPADNGAKPGVPRKRRTSTVLAAVAAVVFAAFALLDFQDGQVVRWHLGSGGFNTSASVAEAHQALDRVPEGVTVRATNNLAPPLLATNEVTLIGSNVDRGDWAIVDTLKPGCPITDAVVPAVMQQLDGMGFRTVFTTGRFVVLQRTAPATAPIRGTGARS